MSDLHNSKPTGDFNRTESESISVGRAFVAWLVAAVLAVAAATIFTIEAQAAPMGAMPSTFELSRGSAILLFAGAGTAMVSVAIFMWRDAYRQTEASLRRGRR
ncbi:hypothetical protein ACKTEK_11020 [Tepidamorphus sp. 3E244]|uniref:hypothetical protein n=1 Tax=Tepidamorphus sp. 3E244 TaxID=3385498 RepID=UPI0038FD0183